MKKLIVISFFVIVIALVGGIFSIGTIIGSAVEKAVNTFGPRITETETRVENVDVSPFSGNAAMSGLYVGNPEGFKNPKAFSFGDIKVAIDLPSTLSDEIIVEEINISSPEFVLEQTARSNNLKTLLDTIKANLGAAQQAEDKAEPGKKVIIRRVIVTGAVVDTTAFGVQNTLSLDSIEIVNDSEVGVTPAQATGVVIQAILSRVLLALGDAAGQLMDDPQQFTQGLVDDGSNLLETTIQSIGEDFEVESEKIEELKEKAASAADEVGEKFQGLFGD